MQYPAENYQDNYNELREKAILRDKFREAGAKLIHTDRTYVLCQLAVWLHDMGYEWSELKHVRSGIRI